LVGWPGETTLAVARMIFSGVFKRHPALKLVLVHGGGNLIFQQGRLDSACEAKGWEADPYFTDNIDEPPSTTLRRLYFDTCTLSTKSNQFIIDTMGPERIVFGTDYPFDIGDPEGKRSVPVIDALPPAARERIYSANALSLLSP
jgi:aminocarboxymuconate-semialdehyde decarboxylase